MSFGLQIVGGLATRELRTEFVTFTDPFINEVMRAVLPPGYWQKLQGFSRSYYSKEAHINSILNYDKPFQFAPQNEDWVQTKRDCFREFSRLPRVSAMSAKTEARSFQQVRYHQGTSAGLGYSDPTQEYPTHKGPPDGANARRARSIASRIVHECREHHARGDWNQFIRDVPTNSTPDIAFTRTQLVELPNFKVRNVFGECFHYVLLEGLFAQPLIDMFMSVDSFYYIGEDPIIGVPRLIESLPEDSYYITLDWSSFDASVQNYELELAFELLESIIDFPDHETELVFKYVKTLFISRKLASPDGRVYLRTGGVPSGSYLTHIIDSIVNWVRIKYLFAFSDIPLTMIKTHGDDSLSVAAGHVDSLNDVIAEANIRLWKLTLEKSRLVQIKSEIEFLGRTSRFGVNHRESLKCLRLLLYPEYPVNDPQISIARLKGIEQDSSYQVEYLPALYHALKARHGDQNVELPPLFRVFNQSGHYTTTNVSI